METVFDAAESALATSYQEGRAQAEARIREKEAAIAGLDAENEALADYASRLGEVADGLLEVAEMSAVNEESIAALSEQLDEVVTGLMEVAELLGGEDGEAVLPQD